MITFQVSDMTCGHCVGVITKALRAVDDSANVVIDLKKHLVLVESVDVEAKALSDAIADAGYTPVRLESVQTVT